MAMSDNRAVYHAECFNSISLGVETAPPMKKYVSTIKILLLSLHTSISW